MKKIKFFLIIFLLINICFVLTGCKKNEKEELKDKTISELEYVNTKVLNMLNALNNLTFENYTISSEKIKLESKTQQSEQGQDSGTEGKGNQTSNEQNNNQGNQSKNIINTTQMVSDAVLTKDKNNIDWKKLEAEIEILNESWSVIVLDLYSLNVDKNLILDFSSQLNNVMLAIKNQNKALSLIELASLYEKIPKFLQEIDADINLQKIRQTQSYVINAYSLADNITNLEINNNIQKAVDLYSEVITNIDYTKDKTYKTNKIYVLLNELANSLTTADSDIFYAKYKNFMEAINEI